MALFSGFANPGGSFKDVAATPSAPPGALRYPHPFFDVGQTYMPITVKHMLRWCESYYQQNGLVASIVNKMAEYPVTDVVFKATSHTDSKTVNIIEDIFKNSLDIETFLIECGIDYYAYGNCFVSIHYPITKMLTCQVCNKSYPAGSLTYKFRNYKFHLDPCPNCGSYTEASAKDVPVKSKNHIRLIRWRPSDIDIIYNQLTGQAFYALRVPRETAQLVRAGNRLVLNDTPQVFIEAVSKNQKVLLSPYNIFHLKRPGISGVDSAWGMPLVLPAFKNLYLYQVLRKAQEAIAHEHIVPLRVIHPMPQGSVDPVQALDLTAWQSTIRGELLRARKDPNYVPVVGLPIGIQYLGGQGRSLMLVSELKQLAEQIAIDMHAPIEFVFGGASFSGASVTIRMLENQFKRHQTQLKKLLTFLIKGVTKFLDLGVVDIDFTSIRTADDIQRKQLLLSMAQANKVSDKTLLAEFSIDPETEQRQIEEEMKSRARLERQQFLDNAENQGKAQIIQARYQAEAQVEAQKRQQALMENEEERIIERQEAAQQPAIGEREINKIISTLKKLPDAQKSEMLQQLKSYVDPQTFQFIQEQVSGEQVDMRPLPSQKPPRREKGIV